MVMAFYSFFSTNSVKGLFERAVGLQQASPADVATLLDVVVLRTVARSLSPAQRQTALSLLRSQPERFVAWLDEAAPSARLAITEALTRTLLSLTVE